MKIPRDLGWGGAEQQKLAPICNDVAADLKSLKAAHDDVVAKYDDLVDKYNDIVAKYDAMVGKYDDLVGKYNSHVHVEDAAVAEAFQGEAAGETALGGETALAEKTEVVSGTLKTVASNE